MRREERSDAIPVNGAATSIFGKANQCYKYPTEWQRQHSKPFWLSFACIIRIILTKSCSSHCVFTAVTQPEKKRAGDAWPCSKRLKLPSRGLLAEPWEWNKTERQRQKCISQHSHTQCQNIKEPAANETLIFGCRLSDSSKKFLFVLSSWTWPHSWKKLDGTLISYWFSASP